MHSLFSASGARKSKHTLPNEREVFALAVGASMQWSKLRDSSNPMFFHNIVEEVKRCEGTERDWSKEQMVHFVQAKLFGGIPQYAVEKWIQSEFLGKRGDEITEHRKAIIEERRLWYACAGAAGRSVVGRGGAGRPRAGCKAPASAPPRRAARARRASEREPKVCCGR